MASTSRRRWRWPRPAGAPARCAQAQDQLVRIGVSGPLSGANAFAGKDDENGVRLAVEELNAQKIKVGGKTLRFELLSEDDQGDPKAGVNVAQKFADAGVKFVLGPYNSGVAIPASRVYNDAGILMSTVGTNPKITQSRYPNVFRIVASDNQVGGSMAAYAAKELKIKTVGVIDDRTAFGQGIADEFAKQARASGLTVAGREFTNDKASDFAAILTAFRAKKVDAIFFGGYAPQGAPMARQMKQLGMAQRAPARRRHPVQPGDGQAGRRRRRRQRAVRPGRRDARQAARRPGLQDALQAALPARPGRVRAGLLRPDHVHRPGHQERRTRSTRPRSSKAAAHDELPGRGRHLRLRRRAAT